MSTVVHQSLELVEDLTRGLVRPVFMPTFLRGRLRYGDSLADQLKFLFADIDFIELLAREYEFSLL